MSISRESDILSDWTGVGLGAGYSCLGSFPFFIGVCVCVCVCVFVCTLKFGGVWRGHSRFKGFQVLGPRFSASAFLS